MDDQIDDTGGGESAPPYPVRRDGDALFEATLWPHRSLSRSGFRKVMLALAVGLSVPLISVWGTPVALFLAPFLIGAHFLVWGMIELNYRAARLSETIRIDADAVRVERREPNGAVLSWEANPYWVTLDMKDTKRIPRYLTLSGAGRTIELGAFLTVEERTTLADALRDALARAKTVAAR